MTRLQTAERDVIRAVAQFLDLHHMVYLRFHPVRPVGSQGAITFIPVGNGKGAPDFLIFGTRWVLAVECKSSSGRLSAAQEAWGQAFTELGHTYKVVRDVAELASDLNRMPRTWERS